MREVGGASEIGVGERVGEEQSEDGFVNVLQGWGCDNWSSRSDQIGVLLSSAREMFGKEEAKPA
jgi:hypothetical protein